MGPIKLSQQDLDAIKAENLRKFRERGLGEYLHSVDSEPYDVSDFQAGMRRAEEQNAIDFAPMNDFIRRYWAEWIK